MTTLSTMKIAETTARPGGARRVPKIMLIRRLRTCAGPNNEPMTTAVFPKPSVPSIGTMCASIAPRVNPSSANAAETAKTVLRRRS